jgi:ubiquinone/menaquinone biosynthesis C-methylase UbiE
VSAVEDSRSFVPAAGRAGLTRFYDATIALTMREQLFRGLLADQVLSGLPDGGRIADVGAGTGTLAIALARAAPTATIDGIDTDPEILAIARAKDDAEKVTWTEGPAARLPLADADCDRVVISLVLHHLDAAAKRAALAEAHRVLRVGGRLHVADWGPAQDPLMRSTFFVLQLIDGFAGTRDHVAGRLPELIEAAGFSALRRHNRLRTAWGSLELLSAERGAD